MKYDFSGYATRFDVRCTDGRTIRRDAFSSQLPDTVPLVYMHNHNDPQAVIGHADLEARDDGVYAYCTFTTGKDISENVPHCRALVEHGDIKSLSIYANQLVERGNGEGKDVIHGEIKEVSLVLAGANPKAKILDFGSLTHADSYVRDENNYDAIIYAGDDNGELEWSDSMLHSAISKEETDVKDEKKSSGEKTIGEILDTLNEEQAIAVQALLEETKKQASASKSDAEPKEKDEEMQHADYVQHADEPESAPKKDKTVGDVLNTLNKDQQAAVAFLIDELKKQLNGKSSKKETAGAEEDKSTKEDKTMKQNAFQQNGMTGADTSRHLSHADERNIWSAFMTGEYTNLNKAIMQYAVNNHLAHADVVDTSVKGTTTYGFEDIDWLFPEAKVLSDEPMLIDNRSEWVKTFIGKTSHQPFTRIKSIYADVRGDDARAKGYATKAKLKVPEVIKLLKAKTEPTTVLKMQQFDKDDLRDITSFDPLKWIDAEMTGKLQEEIARAALISDGREDTDDNKVDESCIVPVIKANDLFTIKHYVDFAATATDSEIAATMVDEAVRSKKEYRGSGNCTLFTTEDWLAEMMLLKDVNGRRIYETEATLCSALRVSNIETVDLMEGCTVTDSDSNTVDVFGIILNPKDYTFGYDNGSQIESYRDFDIKYNQEIILKEIRLSGALRVPFSAIVLGVRKATA